MGQTDAALDSYQKALALQPTSTMVNNAIGNLYLGKDDLKSAGKYFQAALAQDSHNPVAANNLAWVYAVQGENLDMALSLATQAKQIAPDMRRSAIPWHGSSTRRVIIVFPFRWPRTQ